MPGDLSVQLRLLIALALGFLAGLERETTGATSRLGVHAGVRTYSILSLFGYGCAWLASQGAPLALPFGLAAVTALTVMSNRARQQAGHVGFTSEVAAHLTFVVGALCLRAEIWLPLALGISSAVLLSEKAELEAMVDRFERGEFLAVLRFLVVTLLILPVLPNQEYTQFRLNPVRIWKLVILVSSLGFAGYILVRKFGTRYGLWLSGLVGGIVTSTAVSVAMGRFARQTGEQAPRALQAALLASCVMYLRILFLVGFVRAPYLGFLWWKLLALGAVGVLLAALVRRGRPSAAAEERLMPSLINPFEIAPAVVFAALFVVLTVATDLVRTAFGQAGVVAMAVLVGMTDIDPFLLSVVGGSSEPTRLLANALLVAAASNTLAKGFYFAYFSDRLRRAALLRYALWAALHLPLLLV